MYKTNNVDIPVFAGNSNCSAKVSAEKWGMELKTTLKQSSFGAQQGLSSILSQPASVPEPLKLWQLGTQQRIQKLGDVRACKQDTWSSH